MSNFKLWIWVGDLGLSEVGYDALVFRAESREDATEKAIAKVDEIQEYGGDWADTWGREEVGDYIRCLREHEALTMPLDRLTAEMCEKMGMKQEGHGAETAGGVLDIIGDHFLIFPGGSLTVQFNTP